MSKYNTVVDHIIDSIDYIVNERIKNASFDRTRTGRIIRYLGNNKYMVKIDNSEYEVTSISDTIFSQNAIVKILVPENQYSNMFILAASSNPGTDVISFVNSVNGQVGDVIIGISDINGLSEQLASKLTTSSDLKSNIISFTESTIRNGIASGETLSAMLGKISKWYKDLKPVAFSGSYNDLSDKPATYTLPLASSNTLGGIKSGGDISVNSNGNVSVNVTTALGYTPLNSALKGTSNGIAELDNNGKIPTAQLPSYVDDVIEGYYYNSKFYKESTHTTEITAESGKIYIDLSSNKTYRWGGSAYVVISETLALGTTSGTAYRGDRGNTAYTHSQKTSGNPHNVTKSDVGLGNVENKSSATIRGELTKENITTALGYTPTESNYTLPVATSSILGGIKSGTDISVDSNGNVSVVNDSHNHTILNVKNDNYKVGTDLPSTYPRGESVFFSNNPTDKFNGLNYCTVHTIKGYNNMVCIQFIYPYNSDYDVIFYRTAVYNNDVWRSWNTISTTDHTHTVSDITDLTATAIELNYMDGVTSNVQTQLNGKSSTSHTHTYTTIPDTRNDNQNPSWYMSNYSKKVITEFKYCEKIGLSGQTYCKLTTYVPWSDSSGGYPVQEAVVDNRLYIRVGISSTEWGSWGSVYSSSDKPTLGDLGITATTTELNYVDGVTSNIQTQLNTKAATSSVLTKTNTTSFTPTANYHPATKKYVDDKIAAAGNVHSVTASVPASAWMSDTTYTDYKYRAKITVSGVTATNDIIVSILATSTKSQLTACSDAGVRCMGQGQDFVYLYAESKPTTDFQISVLLCN